MECYERTKINMTIKTFRGLIADGAQDTILLHTNDGSTGYRIVKFELFPQEPGTTAQESLCKIFTISQTAVTATVDFNEPTLLASAYIAFAQFAPSAQSYYGMDKVTTFDNMIFNQDIYITHYEVRGSKACNYYIELEQIKLDLNENTVATLKDIRNSTAPMSS